MEKGLIQVYTGEGKGKTTAAIGQAVRAKGRGYKVILVQFLKGRRGSGEISPLEKLGVKVICWGEGYGFILSKLEREEKEKIREKGDKFLKEVFREATRDNYDLLVLDEANVALHYGIINEGKLLDFLKNKPSSLEVILTGRYAPFRIIQLADLVSEVKKVKHPYNSGVKKRKGIDY